MKSQFILLCMILSAIVGCKSGNDRLKVDVSGVAVKPVTIYRYDLDLFKTGTDLSSHLLAIRNNYPFFLDTDLSDPAKLSEMQAYLDNPRNREFNEAVARKYPDISALEIKLADMFRHFRHYFPEFIQPRVYAYISGGDYDYPVQYADTVLLIGLDNYLGKDFKPYTGDGLPAYRITRMVEEQILTDCAKAMLNAWFPRKFSGNNLLEQMVEAGKRLYLLDAVLPDEAIRLKIGYTELQYNWIVKNEKHVWTAIIANRMLYTTDGQLIRSFMADGPFTTEFSKDSPPRLGEWIGWRIVSGYMENKPGESLREMLDEKDAQQILSQSGYKPGE